MAHSHTVYVVTIEHRHGGGVDGIYATAEEAMAGLADWARLYWDELLAQCDIDPDEVADVVTEVNGIPLVPPDDDAMAIRLYWEWAAKRDEPETYEITENEVTFPD